MKINLLVFSLCLPLRAALTLRSLYLKCLNHAEILYAQYNQTWPEITKKKTNPPSHFFSIYFQNTGRYFRVRQDTLRENCYNIGSNCSRCRYDYSLLFFLKIQNPNLYTAAYSLKMSFLSNFINKILYLRISARHVISMIICQVYRSISTYLNITLATFI